MARKTNDIPDDELDCSPENVRHLMDLLEMREETVRILQEHTTGVSETLEMYREQTEEWIDVFNMSQDERGVYLWSDETLKAVADYEVLLAEHEALVRKWNKYAAAFNEANVERRERGRPLAASEHQVATVQRLHKAGESIRSIAAETELGQRTVRTIVNRMNGTDPGAKKRKELKRLELGRDRAKLYRSRVKQLNVLARSIGETQGRAEKLQKAAKGLDG